MTLRTKALILAASCAMADMVVAQQTDAPREQPSAVSDTPDTPSISQAEAQVLRDRIQALIAANRDHLENVEDALFDTPDDASLSDMAGNLNARVAELEELLATVDAFLASSPEPD